MSNVTHLQTSDDHSIEFELCILGSLMSEGMEAWIPIEESGLKVDDFYRESHGALFHLIGKHMTATPPKPVDLMALSQVVKNSNDPKLPTLTELLTISEHVRYSGLGWVCQQIVGHAQIRRIRRFGMWVTEQADSGLLDGESYTRAERMVELIEEHSARLRDSSSMQTTKHSSTIVDEWEAMLAEKDRCGVETFIPTGITVLDEVMRGGLHETDVTIIAARTGMGKTTLGLSIVGGLVRRNVGCGVVTLEMSRHQIMAKTAARIHQIEWTPLKTMSFESQRDREHGVAAMRSLKLMPLWVNDAMVNWSSIRTEIRKMVYSSRRQGHPIKVVMIDYLGMVKQKGSKDQRPQQLENIAFGCKALAKQLNICIMLIVQINRDNEKKPTRIPEISHLRGSGAIEQAADNILLCYRESYYIEKQRPDEIDIIVAKNRAGKRDVVTCAWNGATSTVSDLPFRAVTGGEG